MKRFQLLSLFLLIIGSAGFSSCDVENLAEDSAPRLKVNKAMVQVIQTGKLKNGSTPTVEIVANKGYAINSDAEWLTVDKPQGTGRVILQVLAEPNESGASREGHLTVSSLDRTQTVTVRQSLEEDTDDRMPVGHVYYTDDFSWCVGGSDDVGNKSIGDARNIYTWGYTANGFHECLPLYQARYEDLNAGAKTAYTMDGYIKFDKTNTITAIAIRNLGVQTGKTTSVRVTFRCARYNTDKTNVVVAIEGTGTIQDATIANGRTISPVVNMLEDKLTWNEVSVDISGIDSSTKIIIGEATFVRDNISNTGTFRWYLDDLSVTKIEG